LPKITRSRRRPEARRRYDALICEPRAMQIRHGAAEALDRVDEKISRQKISAVQ
jgi:hypothetical protein